MNPYESPRENGKNIEESRQIRKLPAILRTSFAVFAILYSALVSVTTVVPWAYKRAWIQFSIQQIILSTAAVVLLYFNLKTESRLSKAIYLLLIAFSLFIVAGAVEHLIFVTEL
jgi:hypothetical protein